MLSTEFYKYSLAYFLKITKKIFSVNYKSTPMFHYNIQFCLLILKIYLLYIQHEYEIAGYLHLMNIVEIPDGLYEHKHVFHLPQFFSIITNHCAIPNIITSFNFLKTNIII